MMVLYLLLYHLTRPTLFLLFNSVLFMGEKEEWSWCRSFVLFFENWYSLNITSHLFFRTKYIKYYLFYFIFLKNRFFHTMHPITIDPPSLPPSSIQPPPFPKVTPSLFLLQKRARLPLTTTKRTKQETIRQGKNPHV